MKRALFLTAVVTTALTVLAGCDSVFQSNDGGSSGSGSGDGNEGTGGQADPIPEEKAVEALVAVLENRGLAPTASASARTLKPAQSPDEPTVEDYIETEVASDGDRTLTMNIGPDGNLIPTGEWRDANADYCGEQDRYVKGAVKRLEIKVFERDGVYNAFAQYIDIESGGIEEQRKTTSSGLQDAINTAWGKLNTAIGPATDPCGAQRGYSLHFEATIVFEGTGSDGLAGKTEEDVTATIPLSYNEEKGYFEGTGEITWGRFEFTTTSPDVSVRCGTPPPADMNVVFRAGEKDTPVKEMTGSVEFFDIQPAPCQVTASGVTTEQDFAPSLQNVWTVLHADELDPSSYLPAPSGSVGYFTMEEWQPASGTESIIARTTYDRSKTASGPESSGTFTEDTTVEFRRGDS